MTKEESMEAHQLIARCAIQIAQIVTNPDRDFQSLLGEMPRRQVRDLTKQIFFWVEQIEEAADE